MAAGGSGWPAGGGCRGVGPLAHAADPVSAPRRRFAHYLPGRETDPAFSPDGRQVAFSWNGEKQDNEDIYVQMVGSGEPLRRTSDPAPDSCPVWSPDGTQIAFVRDQGRSSRRLRDPRPGRKERKVADFLPVPGLGVFLGPAISWSPDGKWLAVPELDAGATNGIFLVPAERGEKRTLISSPCRRPLSLAGLLSPGDSLAFVSCTGDRSCDLNLLDLGRDYIPQGQPRRLTRQGAVIEGIAWMPGGRSLIYAASLGYRRRVSRSGEYPPPAERSRSGWIWPALRLRPRLSRVGDRLAFSRYEWDVDIWRFEGNSPRSASLFHTQRRRIRSSRRTAGGSPSSRPAPGRGSELWVADRDGTNLVATDRRNRPAVGMSALVAGRPLDRV